MSHLEEGSGEKVFAVVGGGLSGIAAAWRLHSAGHRVELIERDAVLGGRLGVDRLGDRSIMMGGKNIGQNYTELRKLLSDLGAHLYEPFGINTSRVVDGKVVFIDGQHMAQQMVQLLGESASRKDIGKLLYYGSRVRGKDENRFLGSALFTKTAAKHDHQPLSEHFGPELVETALRPMTLRMNGAEPDEVYLGTLGTNLGMMFDSYDQLTHGVQPLLETFAKRVAVRLNSRVEGVLIRNGRMLGLRVAESGRVTEHHYDGVILAAPAYATAGMVDAELPALGGLLRQVNYFPATVSVVEYARPIFNTQVRAISLGSGPCSNAGAYGMDDLGIVRYTFSGRAARPLPSEELLARWQAAAEDELHELLGIGRVPQVRTVTRQWAAAYCGYLPFHGAFLSELANVVADLGGLELAGDYLRGASLEACTQSGNEAADRLLAHR